MFIINLASGTQRSRLSDICHQYALCTTHYSLISNINCQEKTLISSFVSIQTFSYSRQQGKLKRGMSDDDVTVRPWLPFKKKMVTFLF